jgi:hypothetical protein
MSKQGAMPQHTDTLGGRGQHLYVTRAATIAYQTLIRGQFEEARRALTERLMDARPDPQYPGCYLVDVQGQYACRLRIWTEREGKLIVVPKIMPLD